MNEILAYVKILKEIIDSYYGKETIFYDNGIWYSREHCRNISINELKEWVFRITIKQEDNYNFDDTLS